MALEAFLESYCQLPVPLTLPVNGAGGILESLSSHSSLKNEESSDNILNMAQLNTNVASHFMSTILGRSSTSRTAVGHDDPPAVSNSTLPTDAYLQSLGNTNMEPCISLPSSPMPLSSKNPMNAFSSEETLSQIRQGRQKERKKQQLKNTKSCTDLYKTEAPSCQDSFPARMKQDEGTLTPTLKKPRLDVNQENIQQQQQEQEMIQELLLKELQDRNPQLTEMIQQYRQQNQLQQINSAPQLRGFHLQLPEQQIRSILQDHHNQQGTFAPLLDGALCNRRLKQYLYHLRNNIHDNSVAYWKKFVSEFYAPGAKKRWCFSKYENIELHTTGVFCPISVETWCCDICGSRSGKGLEAISDIFPRLFKIKFESGMLDEILFLDSPRACKISSGLVLEYARATQESVYENFRVVHEGKLRIIFRHDLKILSWEFCAQNHEEFLLRKLVTPQVNQMVQAAETYQHEILNRAPFRVSSEDLQPICDMFVSAGNKLIRNMELPLVNDLGYPKRFIRCLQISEVVDSMKDLMAISHNTKKGPIECLNKYSQGTRSIEQTQHDANGYRMAENGVTSSGSRNSSSVLVNLDHPLLGQNSPAASAIRNRQQACLTGHSIQAADFARYIGSHLQNEGPRSSTHSKNLSHQALVDKLLNEMVAASRGKMAQDSCGEPSNEAARRSDQKCLTGNKVHYGESSRANLLSVDRNINVKVEPFSPEQLPGASRSSGAGFSKIQDWGW